MKCCCQEEGFVRSGIRGILKCRSSRSLPRYVIERCDTCQRFRSDEAAAIYYATVRGGNVRYVRYGSESRVIWSPP
jgi:hypothetical protein